MAPRGDCCEPPIPQFHVLSPTFPSTDDLDDRRELVCHVFTVAHPLMSEFKDILSHKADLLINFTHEEI